MRIAAALLGAVLLLPTAALAEQWDVRCPTDARGTVALTGSDGNWVATPQSSGPSGYSVEAIGGQPALVCHYQLFGADYRVWRRPPPEVPNCRAESWGFICSN
jgi:hypothetical protein